MGTKLSMAEKQMMADVLKEDMDSINAEVTKQFREMWDRCRIDIERELGFHDKLSKIEALQEQIRNIQHEIGEIQASMREYGQHPTLKDYQDAGIKLPKHNNGYIYNHNTDYMGISVNTLMDILIVKRIKSMCNPEQPLMALNEIAQSAFRALVMSGTYEEARASYNSFYELDFQRFGVKIPRRLADIKKTDVVNLMTAQKTPLLENAKGKEKPA